MCGIAGLVDLDGRPVTAEAIGRMTRTLVHRGPDGAGLWVDGPVGLGHRRLAIIDLDGGAQPMASADGQLRITYNGEVYNFRELRAELERRGQRFRTTSDTEVVLAAYEAWGVECLGRLRGMFAFAIWDGRRRRLLLARDRVGIKPLVYAWDGRRLLFASELKAILADPSIPRDLDGDALGDYLAFLYIPAPRTIFRGIRKLPPASYLVLDLDGGAPEIRRYWDLRFAPDEARSEATWVEGLRWHLDDAVRSHLVSDVPVGAFLSGGLDSSTVVALMARAGVDRVRTFSIGFDEPDFDELAYARAVARRYGTEHYEFVVKPDALDVLPRLVWGFDEPFGDASALPTYHVARMTRDHVTVALSGDGGDEGFAGYRRYARAVALHERMDRLPGRLARPVLRLLARAMPRGARGRGSLEQLGADPIERYAGMVAYPRGAALDGLLTVEARRSVAAADGAAWFRGLASGAPPADYLSTLQYLDIRTYLPEDILTKVDRTSMLVSLEARVPLLDHVLLEYAATIPSRFKLSDGTGKVIVRQLMAAALPAEVTRRSKMGFGVPLTTWFRGALAEYTRETLLGRRSRERGVLDPRAVARLIDEHSAGRRDLSARIWALLCFEEWARCWWDR